MLPQNITLMVDEEIVAEIKADPIRKSKRYRSLY